jgi:hypothetical protein
VKLQIVDDLDVEIGKDCEIELPDYMNRLSEEISNSDEDDQEELIVAAGADPKDGKVLLMTKAGRLRVFDARSFHIPDGQALPSYEGKKVFFVNESGRWPGDVEGFYVDSKWLLENSTNALKDAEVTISYRHENNP